MKSDFHIHSIFSGDGKASVEEMCLGAIEKGFDAICFTDHHDVNIFLPGLEAGFAPFTIDKPAEMIKAILEAREKFTELEVLLGIELGTASDMDMAKFALPDELPLDYLLMSCHDAGGYDPYLRQCYEGRTRRQVVEAYYKSVYDGAVSRDYDGLAHLGYVYRYILRYMPYGKNSKGFLRGDSRDMVEAILTHTIDIGASLELNMSGYSLDHIMPDLELIKRYTALGGEAMYFASDAHRPEDIGRHYDAALEIMREGGIKYLAHCRGRKHWFSRI